MVIRKGQDHLFYGIIAHNESVLLNQTSIRKVISIAYRKLFSFFNGFYRLKYDITLLAHFVMVRQANTIWVIAMVYEVEQRHDHDDTFIFKLVAVRIVEDERACANSWESPHELFFSKSFFTCIFVWWIWIISDSSMKNLMIVTRLSVICSNNFRINLIERRNIPVYQRSHIIRWKSLQIRLCKVGAHTSSELTIVPPLRDELVSQH